MHTLLMRSRLVPFVASAVLVPALALSGCSGDDGSKDASASTSQTPSDSGSATTKPYLPVPDGVELTAQGSRLDLGKHAVVAYEPRQDMVGALDIKVTALEKTTFRHVVPGLAARRGHAGRPTPTSCTRRSRTSAGPTSVAGRCRSTSSTAGTP